MKKTLTAISLVVISLVVISLGGCGQKGDLYLPSEQSESSKADDD